jgi:hypothetical protein
MYCTEFGGNRLRSLNLLGLSASRHQTASMFAELISNVVEMFNPGTVMTQQLKLSSLHMRKDWRLWIDFQSVLCRHEATVRQLSSVEHFTTDVVNKQKAELTDPCPSLNFITWYVRATWPLVPVT